jgi:hypothetical protein
VKQSPRAVVDRSGTSIPIALVDAATAISGVVVAAGYSEHAHAAKDGMLMIVFP